MMHGNDQARTALLILAGFGSTVGGAHDRFKLGEQMKNAPPNTVHITPEWQAEPGARKPLASKGS